MPATNTNTDCNTADTHTNSNTYSDCDSQGYAAAATNAAPTSESATLKAGVMSTDLKRLFEFGRSRCIFCLLFVIAVVVAVLGAIDSSRGIAQGADGSTSRGNTGRDQADISVATAPTPPPCNGQLITILDEGFDDVIPPVLPPFWTAINGIDPDGIRWQTSKSGLPTPPFDTPPNAAWVNDPPVISDKYLDGPNFGATESWYVQLTFRHNFNLEASSEDPNVGFDGGVLEISMDGGTTFQDITVWASFAGGEYNRTIATDRGSPLAGRPAWSGNSGGFVTTVVNLPPEIGNAVLRWRMASDNTGSSEGWRVDTASVIWCHFEGTPTPTPPITPTPTPIVTPTPTPTATASPRATLRQRPTPHPRPSPNPP